MTNLFASSLVVMALLAAPGLSAKNSKDTAKPAQAAQKASAATKSELPSTSAKAASPAPTKSEVKEKAVKGGPTQNVTTVQIADAKAKRLVWVNTGTGVYHNDGQYFDATKEGKFMTEAEAKKAGYRSAEHPATAKVAGK